MSYKELILIDNSSSITTLNREIIKEVVKYIIQSADSDTLICVATTNGGIEYLNAYEDSRETKLRTLENLSYEDSATSAKDALLELVTSWKQNDFAERQIILISDGHEAEETYTTEELYFELKEGQYPVHVLCVDQNDNEANLRGLKSIARISKGTVFHTEFEGDDADYDKKIGESILEIINEKEHQYNEETLNKNIKNYSKDENMELENENILSDSRSLTTEKILVDNNILYGENAYGHQTDSVIYEMPDKNKSSYVLPVTVIVTAIVVVTILAILNKTKRKKVDRKKEEMFLDSIKNNSEIGGKFSSTRFSESTDDFNETRSLQSELKMDYEDEDSGTRLLFQTTEGVDITFEDRADPTKYYRALIVDRIVLGRSPKLCDVAFSYDDSVSSKHCELFLRGKDVYVRDLSSANGTVVNQQKVYQEVKINTGDILKLGQLSLFVQILRRNSFG